MQALIQAEARELLQIFALSSDPTRIFLAQSTSQIAAPPRKKGKYVPMFFKPRETWTHDFTCLSYSQQAVAPSKQMKWKLQPAGLGKKRVVFHSKANATQLGEA